MRRKRKAKVVFAKSKVVKKRRKRRTVKPVEKPVGDKYPPQVYGIIGKLMALDLPLRNFVMEVTKALTNERPS